MSQDCCEAGEQWCEKALGVSAAPLIKYMTIYVS